MKRTLAVVLALFVTVTMSVTASKGDTVRIEIKGAALASPLEITDPNIVDNFNIWNGPGVTINGKQVHLDPRRQRGTFIDWPKGAVAEPPKGLHRYEVSFFCTFPRVNEPQLAYVVVYGYDPTTRRGYIYLPGQSDEHYALNVSSIVHGVEGHWFYASGAWEGLVRPLLEKAIVGRLPAAARRQNWSQAAS